jgi:hypothetical protein
MRDNGRISVGSQVLRCSPGRTIARGGGVATHVVLVVDS